MHKIVLLALTLTACGGSTVAITHSAEDAEAPVEAASDAPAHPEAAPDDASPDVPDAPTEAEAGGLLCCSTNGGQNLLVCDPSSPWVCGYTATHPGLCTDPPCVPGDSCQGFNGQGVVAVCGQ